MPSARKPHPKSQLQISNDQVDPYVFPESGESLGNPNIPTNFNQFTSNDQSGIDFNRSEQMSFKGDTTKPFTIGIQDIDESVLYYVENVIKPFVHQNGVRIPVPLIYGAPEKWKSVQKDGYFRDKNGKAMHPYIIIRRTGFEKNRTLANKLDGNNVNNFAVAQGRYNSKNQYTNFDVLNNYLPSEKFYLTPVPDYINVSYDCAIITNLVQENNKIVESVEFASDSYWGNKNRYQFRTYIDRFDSTNEYSISDQRVAKTSLSITLYGYIIPETINRDLATKGQRQFFSKSVVSITAETVKNVNNSRAGEL
jgi:hypothetical protein